MPQVLRRLTDIGLYAIVDCELITICTPATSYGSVDLIGTAFKTRDAGWRCLRWGLVDVGFRPSVDLALERLVEEHLRIGRPQTIAAALAAVEPEGRS
jgi:hypothetical protein